MPMPMTMTQSGAAGSSWEARQASLGQLLAHHQQVQLRTVPPHSSGLCSLARTLGSEIEIVVGAAAEAATAGEAAAEAGAAAEAAVAIAMTQTTTTAVAIGIVGVAAGGGTDAGAVIMTTPALAPGCGTTTATTPTAAGWAILFTPPTGHLPLHGASLRQGRSRRGHNEERRHCSRTGDLFRVLSAQLKPPRLICAAATFAFDSIQLERNTTP